MKKIKITESDGIYSVYLLIPTFFNPKKELHILDTKRMHTITDIIKIYGMTNLNTDTLIYDKIKKALE